jgi:hypothetical protein
MGAVGHFDTASYFMLSPPSTDPPYASTKTSSLPKLTTQASRRDCGLRPGLWNRLPNPAFGTTQPNRARVTTGALRLRDGPCCA